MTPSAAGGAPQRAGPRESEQELVAYLERDQLTAGTAIPLPRAHMGVAIERALWALRVAVALLAFMVVYTFIERIA